MAQLLRSRFDRFWDSGRATGNRHPAEASARHAERHSSTKSMGLPWVSETSNLHIEGKALH